MRAGTAKRSWAVGLKSQTYPGHRRCYSPEGFLLYTQSAVRPRAGFRTSPKCACVLRLLRVRKDCVGVKRKELPCTEPEYRNSGNSEGVCKVPTFHQLVKQGRTPTRYKTASPALQGSPQRRG